MSWFTASKNRVFSSATAMENAAPHPLRAATKVKNAADRRILRTPRVRVRWGIAFVQEFAGGRVPRTAVSYERYRTILAGVKTKRARGGCGCRTTRRAVACRVPDGSLRCEHG